MLKLLTCLNFIGFKSDMIFVTEAQIGNLETSALTTSGNVALQYFKTGWVTITLLVPGGLKGYEKRHPYRWEVTITLLVPGGLKEY